MLVLADRPLPAGAERDALTSWVEQGGLLIRFAGPRTAEQPIGETDPLMPVKLLGGDRQLGGALSWAEPAGVAQFTASSPFAGLAVPDEVKVNRQVLAEPSADLAGHTWAALADGTPLVTQATRGAGRVVLFHVTANADWSNLPLSGLFVDMLRRLVALSAGRRDPLPTTPCWRRPRRWTASACCRAPPQAATGLPANEIATHGGIAAPSARAVRAGEWQARTEPRRQSAGARGGAASARRAGSRTTPRPRRSARSGPALLAVAVVLLALDLLIALGLRGLLRPSRVGGASLLLRLADRTGGAGTGEQPPTRRWPRGSATSSPATPSWTACRAPGWRDCRNTSTAAPPRPWWNPTRSSRAGPTSASIRCSIGRSAPTRSRSRRSRRRR